MKYLLLFLIKLYWLLPQKHRRKCLFKVSCSHHVYDVTNKEGLFAGIKSLLRRYKQCRPGYAIYTSDDLKGWVIFSDGSIVDRCDTNI